MQTWGREFPFHFLRLLTAKQTSLANIKLMSTFLKEFKRSILTLLYAILPTKKYIYNKKVMAINGVSEILVYFYEKGCD